MEEDSFEQSNRTLVKIAIEDIPLQPFEQKDSKGNNALLKACKVCNSYIIGFSDGRNSIKVIIKNLLKKGADTTVVNNAGECFMDYVNKYEFVKQAYEEYQLEVAYQI